MRDHELIRRHEQQMKIGEVGQFSGLESRYCSTFGCRKLLTLVEQLAGSKCLHCQGEKDTIFKHYKY